jgi:hypothetical protein
MRIAICAIQVRSLISHGLAGQLGLCMIDTSSRIAARRPLAQLINTLQDLTEEIAKLLFTTGPEVVRVWLMRGPSQWVSIHPGHELLPVCAQATAQRPRADILCDSVHVGIKIA